MSRISQSSCGHFCSIYKFNMTQLPLGYLHVFIRQRRGILICFLDFFLQDYLPRFCPKHTKFQMSTTTVVSRKLVLNDIFKRVISFTFFLRLCILFFSLSFHISEEIP